MAVRRAWWLIRAYGQVVKYEYLDCLTWIYKLMDTPSKLLAVHANWITFFMKYEVYQLSKYLFLSVWKIVSIKVHLYIDRDCFYQLKSRLTWSTEVWYYLYQLRFEVICINWDSNLLVSINIFDNWVFLSIEVQDYIFLLIEIQNLV
jgi:hypothetical protein